MPWKYSDEYYREYTRTTWNASATAYVSFMRNLAPFHSALIERLRPRAGERILDLGTGPGEPAISIAREVGPQGRVIGVDLSETMVSLASQAARSQGLDNIEFRTMDCADLSFADGSFDAVVSSFGFQIFTDPQKAAREAHRVLRPQGRICVIVWSTGDRVPFLDAIVAPMLEHAEPDENGYIPTPYETGGPGEMVAFLNTAGFRDAKESVLQHPMQFANGEDYLQSILTATPIGHSLSEEEPGAQQEILRKTRENLKRWETPTGVSLPAECVLVSAAK
ncbi:MAG: methyltransferase domain-containing protein [Thermoplasmata archaeon]